MGISDRAHSITIATRSARTAQILWFVADLLDYNDELDQDEAPEAATCVDLLVEGIRDLLGSPESIIGWWGKPDEWKFCGRVCQDIADIVAKANAFTEEDRIAIRRAYRENR